MLTIIPHSVNHPVNRPDFRIHPVKIKNIPRTFAVTPSEPIDPVQPRRFETCRPLFSAGINYAREGDPLAQLSSQFPGFGWRVNVRAGARSRRKRRKQ